MLFQLPEYSAHIWISGYDSRLEDFDEAAQAIGNKFPGTHVQFADLEKVPGSRYLFLATLNAVKSFSRKPISKSLSMEILLYLAANRQIIEAIRLIGIAPTTEKVAVVFVGKTEEDLRGAAELLSQTMRLDPRDELIDSWSNQRIRNVRAVFQIGAKELSATLKKGETKARAVERLAIERSALLTIKK